MTIDAFLLPIQVLATRPMSSGDEGLSVLFEDIYDRHLDDVFRYALLLTGDRHDAEDVASETFARALRAWRKGREPDGPALPWLLVVARNVATDRWRKDKRLLARPIVETTSPSDTARLEASMWLESVVTLLPVRQREVIALRYHDDLSVAEIATVMGLSESGVRSLVARAMDTLRKHPEVWE
jgi:RNA polymerase sigma-70 factor (ECF subfamily)